MKGVSVSSELLILKMLTLRAAIDAPKLKDPAATKLALEPIAKINAIIAVSSPTSN